MEHSKFIQISEKLLSQLALLCILWEQQNDIAQALVTHAKAVLIEGLDEDFVNFLFEANDGIGARKLFNDKQNEAIQIAVDAMCLAARIDDLVASAVPTSSETLNELLEKKWEKLG